MIQIKESAIQSALDAGAEATASIGDLRDASAT
jgi:hypothetical protein